MLTVLRILRILRNAENTESADYDSLTISPTDANSPKSFRRLRVLSTSEVYLLRHHMPHQGLTFLSMT